MNIKVKKLLNKLIMEMKSLHSAERCEIYLALNDLYCKHCGREHHIITRTNMPPLKQECQCWNDD